MSDQSKCARILAAPGKCQHTWFKKKKSKDSPEVRIGKKHLLADQVNSTKILQP